MNRSDELSELTKEGLESFASGGLGFFTDRISRQDGVLAIGTDPKEWWAGYDTIVNVFQAQSEAMQGMAIVNVQPQAYSAGNVGWVAAEPAFRLPDGTELPFRLTAVYHKEDGDWRIVQWHASLGVANEDAIGEELPI
ncbi:MAG TPA: nuclear transport factor 2 family protein [Chloroflexota bacterium]|nr:nuclear transport factor 2 family protein [Chloroflexota bacterium]HUM67321.1 nuclear transport factor 2 family protein [Chloroflexota bacterium]